MIKRWLGKTDLRVSIVGLGGLGIIDKFHPTYASSSAVINYALDNDINFIETGRSYFDSEERIGAVLKLRRNDCYIATKTMGRSAKEARKDIEISLRKFKTDYIDIYQLHDVRVKADFDEVMGTNGALEALKVAKKEGKIRFIGFSSHKPETAIRLINTGEFDTAQIPYNPIDAKIFKPVLDEANKRNMGIIVMKPLAGGILDDVESALSFVFAEDFSTVIIGARSIEQLKVDIETGRSYRPLSKEEQEKISKEIAKLGDNFCRQCRYCITACPEKIAIPDIFRLERYAVTYYMRDVAKKEYLLFDSNSLDCTSCNLCKAKCPYELAIPEMLKRAHKNIVKPRPQEIIFKILDFLRLTKPVRGIIIFLKNAAKRK